MEISQMQRLEPPTQKVDRRIRRTKNAITTAFLQLLNEKDISKITIKELCENADINRKTFYTYYDNVKAVLSEIENDVISQFVSTICSLKSKKNPLSVSDVFVCIGDLLNNYTKFIFKLVQVDALDSLQKKVNTTIKDLIFTELSKDARYDTDMLKISLEYIVTGAVAIYLEWFSSNSTIPFKEFTSLTNELVNADIAIALKCSNKTP